VHCQIDFLFHKFSLSNGLLAQSDKERIIIVHCDKLS
jgi:hypothetical protein